MNRPLGLLIGLAGLAGVEAVTAVLEWTWPASSGGRVYWRGRHNRRAVALTFDDGPTPYTSDVLDILRQHRVRGTFFVLGARIARLPSIARRIVDEGHEIGNHTQTLGFQPVPQRFYLPGIGGQVEQAQRTILEVTGVRPRFFRTPAGQVGRNLWREVARLDLMVVHGALPIALPRLSAGTQLAILRRQIAPGAILILHDGLDSNLDSRTPLATIELLPKLLGLLQQKDFEIVPLGELLGLDV